MQAEAGQGIQSIVARKECERRAGSGTFFWGIGSAPNRSIRALAGACQEIDVVFSLMKTRPKLRDVSPAGVLLWQTFFDMQGMEQRLPPHVLVTSRMETSSGLKKVHYALVCQSDQPLQMEDHGPFDPSAYRNVSEFGGCVSQSQVTALLERIEDESPESAYRINFRAKLTKDYWVRLGRPCVLPEQGRTALAKAFAQDGAVDCDDWLDMLSEIKSLEPLTIGSSQCLF